MNNLSIRKAIAAGRTLEGLGYTYHGGEQWKPPLGKSAAPLLDRITELEAENERLKNVAQFKEDVATTLRAQLADAKKDAERLAYLDSLATYSSRNFMGGTHHLVFTHYFDSPNSSFYAAIDAAIAEGKQA